jgi:pimeloyl-ACP methyl ester carboxylesterase
VGHSFGADIALHFALRHPERVRRLALLEAGLAVTLDDRKRDEWAGWSYWVSKLEEAGITVPAERRSDFRYLLNLSLDTPRFYGPARSLPRKREPLLRLINETSIVGDYEQVSGMTREAIAGVRTPTLVVYGEHSYFMGSYHLLGELLPNRELVLLPGGEHFGPLEQPEPLVEHLRTFFAAGELNVPERMQQRATA